LDFNITDNFHFYGGIGFDVWSNSKAKFKLKSMDRNGWDEFDFPIYSDEQELENLQNNSFGNTLLLSYSSISKVYGFYYQMNNIKIGYRHYGAGLTKGLHQLTLGYDIGRYKYQ
jgi:type IV secretory pathway VirB6-like protein